MLSASQKKLLQSVLSLPTASFHEHAVMQFVRSFASFYKLPIQRDRSGNLKITYRSGSVRTPTTFVAHMDHPGFEVVQGGNKKVRVRLLGGVNPKQFLGSKILICSEEGLIPGRVTRKIKKDFEVAVRISVARGDFGYFDFPGCLFRSGKICSKGLDNVNSVSALLELLRTLKQKKMKAHVVCLFTRAEEVGFIGAMSAIENNFVPRNGPIIVMETSSAKGGRVQVGGGPVLRVGDKMSVFTPGMDLWLHKTAQDLQKKKKDFLFQRALMAGGSTEASIFLLKGFVVGSLAFPLENYHNQGKTRPAMEIISQKDYADMQRLLVEICTQTMPKKLVEKTLARAETRFRKLRKYL